MALDLLSLVTIAKAPILTMPTAKVINAMAMIQSSVSSPSAIELADAAQKRLFVVSVVFGVVAALIAALLASLVWRANDRYQDAVKTDADARIAIADARAAEANAVAAQANEGLAKSNEEIARLTNEAEQARTERAEADKQIAVAKADAARAREGVASAEAVSARASVEVASLQVVVANAEQKRAEAEQALLTLQHLVKDRHLQIHQYNKLLELLKGKPSGTFSVLSIANNPETETFAKEIAEAMKGAGWTLLNHEYALASSFRGVGLIVQNADTPRAAVLQRALIEIGLSGEGSVNPSKPPDTVILFVGSKP